MSGKSASRVQAMKLGFRMGFEWQHAISSFPYVQHSFLLNYVRLTNVMILSPENI